MVWLNSCDLLILPWQICSCCFKNSRIAIKAVLVGFHPCPVIESLGFEGGGPIGKKGESCVGGGVTHFHMQMCVKPCVN